jgi:hypothetical protein
MVIHYVLELGMKNQNFYFGFVSRIRFLWGTLCVRCHPLLIQNLYWAQSYPFTISLRWQPWKTPSNLTSNAPPLSSTSEHDMTLTSLFIYKHYLFDPPLNRTGMIRTILKLSLFWRLQSSLTHWWDSKAINSMEQSYLLKSFLKKLYIKIWSHTHISPILHGYLSQ